MQHDHQVRVSDEQVRTEVWGDKVQPWYEGSSDVLVQVVYDIHYRLYNTVCVPGLYQLEEKLLVYKYTGYSGWADIIMRGRTRQCY